MQKAINFIANGAPWAITESMMETIISVSKRENDIEALRSRLDRPLDNTRETTVRNGTAVIPITGPIFPKANMFTEISGATSVDMLALDLNQAIDDRTISNIVLDIDSPGGNVIGINEFANMVSNSPKPVTAFVGGMAASAAFWIASAADQIVIDDTAQVGNIGVVTSRIIDDDEKIELVSSRAPDKRADITTEEGRAVIQANLDKIEDVFISTVSLNRVISEDDIASHRGRILIGSEAVAAGFADALGSLESVIAGDSGNSKKERGAIMATAKTEAPEITKAYIAENYPDIAEAFQKEGENKALSDIESMIPDAKKEGAEQERSRIQAVEEQSIFGHEKLINTMKFDGQTTGEQAAVAILKAEKEVRSDYANQMANEAPKPVESKSSDEVDKVESFDDKVDAMVYSGETKGFAIAAVARKYPDLHKAWLARINTKQAGGI